MQKILNLRDGATHRYVKNGLAVRIDRQTQWGNPFVIGKHGDREEVIAKYRRHLWRRIQSKEVSLEELASLDSKSLACWCAPHPCHGEVLARASAWAKSTLEKSK